MGRGFWAGALGVSCAALGAWVGQRLGDSTATAGMGAAIGAASGAVAPSVAGWVVERSTAKAKVTSVAELPRVVDRPSRLLDPIRRVVDFTGRENELARLLAWCEHDAAARLQLITGPGGVGKTRLALRLCELATELGWRCEWVGDGRETNVVDAVRAATHGRVLLVVDYAETRIGLPFMLRAVAADRGSALRVLLLARSAGQWWNQLGAGEQAVRDLVSAAGPEGCRLSEVIDAQLSGEEQVRRAVPFFARALGVHPPALVQVSLRNSSGRPCPASLKMCMKVSLLVAMWWAVEGPAGVCWRGLGVRAGGVVVSLT